MWLDTKQQLKVCKCWTTVKAPPLSWVDRIGLSDCLNVALWFSLSSLKRTAFKRHQSSCGCVSKQRLYDFIAEPRVITVLPPHRCYGDCWATVTDQRPQCPYLCVRGWPRNVCRHRICSTSCCDLWYTDNSQGRSYNHLRWGWGIMEGLLFKSATIKYVISCPWASTQGWILTRTFYSLSLLIFIWISTSHGVRLLG